MKNKIIEIKNALDTRGRGYEDICIRIVDSLCYTAKINTPL